MASQSHILVVEDDAEIRTLIARYLHANEYRVSVVGDGREMERQLSTSRVDLIILDINLPGEDGLSLCRRFRTTSLIPIIMLTAKGEDVDRIIGLEMGADDYLAKPFNPRELLARIRAVLRRRTQSNSQSEQRSRLLKFAAWELDVMRRTLSGSGGVQIILTGAEFDLLHALCMLPGQILSRDQLVDLTQRRTAGPCERSIDVLVSRLRRKLEPNPRTPELIKTIRSGGYLFTPEVERS